MKSYLQQSHLLQHSYFALILLLALASSALAFSDSLQGAAGTDLAVAGNWSKATGPSPLLYGSGGVLCSGGNGLYSDYVPAKVHPLSSDYSDSVTVNLLSSQPGQAGILLRYNASANTRYSLFVFHPTSTSAYVAMYRQSPGTNTAVWTSQTFGASDGSTVYLVFTVSGASLSWSVTAPGGGSYPGSWSDSAPFTSGVPAIEVDGSGFSLSSFSATNQGTGPLSGTRIAGYIGDSITSGTGATNGPIAAQVASTLLGFTYGPNEGRPGSLTADWLPSGSYLPLALADFQAAHVTDAFLMLGTNDAAHGVSLATYRSNMQAIIAALVSAGIAHIHINESPYVNGQPGAEAVLAQYVSNLPSLCSGAGVVLGDTGAQSFFKAQPQLQMDGVHPNDAGYYALGQLWAGQVPSGYPPPPEMNPAGKTLGPASTLQFYVTGLLSGVSVSSWQLAGTVPSGVTLSSSGLLNYGPADAQNTTVSVVANLSDASILSGNVTLSPTASGDTGVPDNGTPDSGVFNGTVGPATNGYINLLIKNFGIPGVLAGLALCGWMFVRRLARGTSS